MERKSTKNHELKGRHNFKKENAHNPIRKKSLIHILFPWKRIPHPKVRRNWKGGWWGHWAVVVPLSPWETSVRMKRVEWITSAYGILIQQNLPVVTPHFSCGEIKESQHWYKFIWRQRASLRKALASLGEADVHPVNTQVCVSCLFLENVKSLNNNSGCRYTAS